MKKNSIGSFLPDVCKECLVLHQDAFRASMLTFDKAIIYVRKVINEKIKGGKKKENSGTSSPSEEIGAEKDPEFIQV